VDVARDIDARLRILEPAIERRIARFARGRIAGQDVDDVHQECLVSAWKHIARGSGSEVAPGWLSAVVGRAVAEKRPPGCLSDASRPGSGSTAPPFGSASPGSGGRSPARTTADALILPPTATFTALAIYGGGLDGGD
jgi:hypothetical protein